MFNISEITGRYFQKKSPQFFYLLTSDRKIPAIRAVQEMQIDDEDKSILAILCDAIQQHKQVSRLKWHMASSSH